MLLQLAALKYKTFQYIYKVWVSPLSCHLRLVRDRAPAECCQRVHVAGPLPVLPPLPATRSHQHFHHYSSPSRYSHATFRQFPELARWRSWVWSAFWAIHLSKPRLDHCPLLYYWMITFLPLTPILSVVLWHTYISGHSFTSYRLFPNLICSHSLGEERGFDCWK